ncbi:NUDIX domain-containing protein [Paenibacillus sp. 32352]|uniref:NUDIX domain-containing protein n=1 Tax=Paenibacillus sp. 32352 TaxID=1969111 RepID=UPI0009ABD299|nr:NUDIX hydrolase [Paenibacillus sp. 32352]
MAGVRVFVLDEEDRLLLVQSDYKKQGPEHMIWVIPGGGIEPGEYSRDAAIREVKEETGLDIRVERLLWVVEEKEPDGEVDYCHYFLAEVTGGQLSKGYDPEWDMENQVIMDVQFFSREDMSKLSNVYPEAALDEFWDLAGSAPTHDPWRSRPSRGFGCRK